MGRDWPIQSLIATDGLDWLHEQATRVTSAVEVGSWYGGGTAALLLGCPGPVYAVDHWRGSPDHTDATHFRAQKEAVYDGFIKNVGHHPNLHILKMPSVEAAAQFAPRAIDLVFIDAGHDAESVDADVAAWWPICRTLFCGHDWSHAPVRAAVERLGRPISHHPATIWSVRCDG